MNRTTDEPVMRSRNLGRLWLGPSFDYLLFLRPRQWPILSFQLAVGVLMAPASAAYLLGQDGGAMGPTSFRTLFVAWLVWVVCLNGGTLAFNSAFDRDTGDIAYLRRPPSPPPRLALYALFMMLFGAGAAWGVSPIFALVTGACVVLSILYSHSRTRWKSLPGLDLAVNMVGYGAGTTIAGLSAGAAAFGATAVVKSTAVAEGLTRSVTEGLTGGLSTEFTPGLTPGGWYLVVAFGLLFGSFYPLTQIYQLDDDCKRGDRTLTSTLGTRPSLTLAILLGMLATTCFLMAATSWPGARHILPLVLALTAWLVHLVIWLVRVPRMTPRDHEHGMYRALLLWALVDVAVLLSRYGLAGAGGQM